MECRVAGRPGFGNRLIVDITICAVGRLGPGPERELIERFSKRLRWNLEIREVAERRKLPPPALRERECELLQAACPRRALRVALDRTGNNLDSAELAARLEAWRDSGRGVAFVIGGAEGLTASFRERADFVLGFGAATWPHMLIRAMLTEQLYRAQEILAGNPYHRDSRRNERRAAA